MTATTTFYRINGVFWYVGSVTSEDIQRWIDFMSRAHPKAAGAYTEADWCMAHGETLTETAPPDAGKIGGYRWINQAWSTVTTIDHGYADYCQTLQQVQKKRADAYRSVCDPLRLEIEENAVRAGRIATVDDLKPWLAAKDHVRSLYPKPIDPTIPAPAPASTPAT